MDLVSRRGFSVEGFDASEALGKALNNFGVPLGIWTLALLLAGGATLPDFLSGLRVHGPYLVLLGGLLLSLAFRIGRAFFVLASLSAAYFAFLFFVDREPAGAATQAVSAALCVFVPLNITVFALLRERGILNAPGLRRLSLPVIEAGVIAAILISDAPEFADVLSRPIVGTLVLPGIVLPQWSLLFTAAAIATGVVCAVLRGSAIDAAFAAAAATFALGCNSLPSFGAFAWFCAAAGLIVAFAVVQDSHRLAFYDELTGLPGRRALNERLMAIDGHFTLAMVDIDHFKAFNDTWGHDIGDQVLKLVAAQLQRIGGGGTAYRYGGEEFALLFPGRRGEGVVEHIEALRQRVDEYKVMLRQERRRGEATGAGKVAAAGDAPAGKWISVTVSIGVAERENRMDAPAGVIEAADRALYRAKAAGRNRVVSH